MCVCVEVTTPSRTWVESCMSVCVCGRSQLLHVHGWSCVYVCVCGRSQLFHVHGWTIFYFWSLMAWRTFIVTGGHYGDKGSSVH